MHWPLVIAALFWLWIGLRKLRPAARLEQRLSRARIPELYPQLDARALEALIDADAAARIERMPILELRPLAAEGTAERSIGIALSRILIRELQRAPGLSVRGPEDTTIDGRAEPEPALSQLAAQRCVFGGALHADGDGYRAQIWLARHGASVERGEIAAADACVLLERCGAFVLEQLGLERGRAFSAPAAVSWPRRREALQRLGEAIALSAASSDVFDIDDAVLALLREGPKMSVAGHLLSERHVALKLELLAAYPEDAQLCFSLFSDVWSGTGPERRAFQFVRRALEISPGHGKAHMVAPHAAEHPERLGAHAELGYALLPDNSFGASNYLHWLGRWARDPQRVVTIALAVIERAPQDPHSYYHLIDAYEALRDTRRALETARQLLRYLSPLDPRTRECFEQNPQTRQRLQDGKWDPAAELRARVARFEATLQPKPTAARPA